MKQAKAIIDALREYELWQGRADYHFGRTGNGYWYCRYKAQEAKERLDALAA